MNQILVLFAHPAFRRSRANRVMMDGLETLEGVTVRDLYELYPDLDIEVESEQNALEEHEIVIFQHPFFWYSTPAILKEWQDLVLEHGWAYGTGGNALKDKVFFCALTAGGRSEAYQPEGYNHFTVRQLLAPLEQTANLCGMRYLPPFVIHGTLLMDEQTVSEHRSRYFRALEALRDGEVDLDEAARLPYLNDLRVPTPGRKT